MCERTFEIKQVGVEYVCDSCGVGTMEKTGMALLSNPAQYVHRCNNCGHDASFRTTYPGIRMERVEVKP